MPSESMMHEDFWGAADWLRQFGWTQEDYESDNGEGCLIWALLTQLNIDDVDSDREVSLIVDERHLDVLQRVLAKHTGDYKDCRKLADKETMEGTSEADVIEYAVFEWNDRFGRKPEEIIRMLELAGELAWEEWYSFHHYDMLVNNGPRYDRDVVFGSTDLSAVLSA